MVLSNTSFGVNLRGGWGAKMGVREGGLVTLLVLVVGVSQQDRV